MVVNNKITKQLSNDFIHFTYDEVFAAYRDCLRNKSNSLNAINFEKDDINALVDLCHDINKGTYEIGSSIAFVVKIPVYREVFAADFVDRIVHHLIIAELRPYFDAAFITESFSCREGKGVMYGLETIQRKIKECTDNYTKDAWILKMDVKSFFMSINKHLLSQRVDEFIVEKYPDNRKKECLRWLCKLVIMNQPEKNCKKRGDLNAWEKLPKGKSLFDVGEMFGLPIGNLTSQIFANFFLNPLDKYIKDVLGFKYYGRYVDDFVIISDNWNKLRQSIPLIDDFARENIGITIHPKKRYFQHYTKGVNFIGGVIKKDRRYILNRTIEQFYYKIKNNFAEPNIKNLDKMVSVVNSYMGFMRFYNEYKQRKKCLSRDGILKPWYDKGLIICSYGYTKVIIVKDKQTIQELLDSIPVYDKSL